MSSRAVNPKRQDTFIEQARRSQMIRRERGDRQERLSAASLVAIARRAGVNGGVISYHFDNKDDLVE